MYNLVYITNCGLLITFDWHINYIMTPIDGAEPHVEETTTTFSGGPHRIQTVR